MLNGLNETLGFDNEGIKWTKEKRIKQIQSGRCFVYARVS